MGLTWTRGLIHVQGMGQYGKKRIESEQGCTCTRGSEAAWSMARARDSSLVPGYWKIGTRGPGSAHKDVEGLKAIELTCTRGSEDAWSRART